MLEGLAGLTFACPWAFALALAIPPAGWMALRRARRGGVKFSAFAELPAAGGGWRQAAAAAAPVFMVAALALLCVAAARPRTEGAREWKRENAVSIEMAVDVSGSMLAEDMSPGKTRLDVVKSVFKDFVSRRPADLIGLVTFAGYTKTAVPLTSDHQTLCEMLDRVRIPDPRRYRDQAELFRRDQLLTAIGDGLVRALDRLRGASTKSSVAILLSDGANNAGIATPEEAAAAAKEAGVKVYTIGVGRRGRGFGDGEFDEDQLRGIAEATGGRYFAADDARGLEEAVAEIDKLEKTDVEKTVEIRWEEHFPEFLAAGMAAAAIGALLGLCSKGRVA